MVTIERKKELIQQLFDAVVAMDEVETAKICQTVLDENINAYEAVSQGLSAAMEKVGELYSKNEYFVPELLLCSDALYAGLDILRPHIKIGEAQTRRQIILGTVEGDIHDIGKNLVRIMFEAAGWVVHDLGKDVPLAVFVEEQKRLKADVIGISALMTTSMLAMPIVIKMIREQDTGVAIMLGGAPLTLEIAGSYGADGYAQNAGEAVREANAMLARIGR
ncbi:MAG: corrinoid protein [Dehalococcoidales bacterium]|nr:corrinoid protein [Dehalococcoidales bacterium]